MALVEASRSRALAGWVTLGLWICRGAGARWDEGRAVFYRLRQTWQFDLGSSAFSKSSLNIWKFLTHVLFQQPSLENFEHYFASM